MVRAEPEVRRRTRKSRYQEECEQEPAHRHGTAALAIHQSPPNSPSMSPELRLDMLIVPLLSIARRLGFG